MALNSAALPDRQHIGASRVMLGNGSLCRQDSDTKCPEAGETQFLPANDDMNNLVLDRVVGDFIDKASDAGRHDATPRFATANLIQIREPFRRVNGQSWVTLCNLSLPIPTSVRV